MKQCKECGLSREEIDSALKPLIEVANALGIKTTHVVDKRGVRLLQKQPMLSKKNAN